MIRFVVYWFAAVKRSPKAQRVHGFFYPSAVEVPQVGMLVVVVLSTLLMGATSMGQSWPLMGSNVRALLNPRLFPT